MWKTKQNQRWFQEPAALVCQRFLRGNDLSVTFSRNVTCFFPWKFWTWRVSRQRIARTCRRRARAHDLHLNLLHTKALGRQTHRHVLRTGASPCSSPMRNLEEVIKTRWAEVTWVSSGVRTVRNPQADAESRRTFSPPILEDKRQSYQTQGEGKRAKSPSQPQVLFQV